MDLFTNISLIELVYFCRFNRDDNSRMKEGKNISKKTSNSSKYKLELWSEEHKKTSCC